MKNAERFNFTPASNQFGEIDLRPLLPLTLERDGRLITTSGLVDSGSSINVLPYKLGLELGVVWEDQTIPLKLVGNLANFEARAVIISAKVSNFSQVNLAFAWTIVEDVPLILGQMNFFMEFNICFYRSQQVFDVQLKD